MTFPVFAIGRLPVLIHPVQPVESCQALVLLTENELYAGGDMWEPNPHSPRLTGSRGGLLTLVWRYTAATTPLQGDHTSCPFDAADLPLI